MFSVFFKKKLKWFLVIATQSYFKFEGKRQGYNSDLEDTVVSFYHTDILTTHKNYNFLT